MGVVIGRLGRDMASRGNILYSEGCTYKIAFPKYSLRAFLTIIHFLRFHNFETSMSKFQSSTEQSELTWIFDEL